MKKIVIPILLLLALAMFFIVSQSNQEVENLNSEDFEQLISSNSVFVINTHTPYIGEIENTDLIAEDWDNMYSYIDELPEDKSIPIAVYCRSGNMAETSSKQLIEMGYTNVYNLEGGMNSWESSGRDLVFDNYEGPLKEFDIIASNWDFNPGLIQVNLGDRVVLHIESVDVYHGIALPDFGVNKQLPPGENVKVEFIADKKGTFSFFCSVSCGGGHNSMGGQLIVS